MKHLIPAFLKRIDQYLLLNHPIVWISRIHIVLFYGLITWSFSALSGFVIPISLAETQDLGLWYFLFSIIALIALCFWIYHNIIFNLEKKYGKRRWFDEYKVFFLNICCVFTFISFPMPFTAVYNARVANIVSDEEFIRDINTLNAAEPFVLTNINNYNGNFDSIRGKTFFDLRRPITMDLYTPWTMKYDTLVHPGLASNYQIGRLYESARKNDTEVRKLILDYTDIWKKYGVYQYAGIPVDSIFSRWKYLSSHSPMSDEEFYSYRQYYYNSYELDRVFSNISDAKYKPLFLIDRDFQNFLLYACLYVSLLVMLFKMVPWRQFLITVITCILLPIILFIISQLIGIGYSSRDSTYFVLLVTALVVALVFTLLGILPAKQFQPFRSICMQLTYLALPLLPFICFALAKTIFFHSYDDYSYAYDYAVSNEMLPSTDAYYRSWPYHYGQLEVQYWHNWFDLWLSRSLYGGLILFVVAFLPLMKGLFVRHLSLPHRS